MSININDSNADIILKTEDNVEIKVHSILLNEYFDIIKRIGNIEIISIPLDFHSNVVLCTFENIYDKYNNYTYNVLIPIEPIIDSTIESLNLLLTLGMEENDKYLKELVNDLFKKLNIENGIDLLIEIYQNPALPFVILSKKIIDKYSNNITPEIILRTYDSYCSNKLFEYWYKKRLKNKIFCITISLISVAAIVFIVSFLLIWTNTNLIHEKVTVFKTYNTGINDYSYGISYGDQEGSKYEIPKNEMTPISKIIDFINDTSIAVYDSYRIKIPFLHILSIIYKIFISLFFSTDAHTFNLGDKQEISFILHQINPQIIRIKEGNSETFIQITSNFEEFVKNENPFVGIFPLDYEVDKTDPEWYSKLPYNMKLKYGHKILFKIDDAEYHLWNAITKKEIINEPYFRRKKGWFGTYRVRDYKSIKKWRLEWKVIKEFKRVY